MTIMENHLWGPMPDAEMKELARLYIRDLGLHATFLQNGACDLAKFAPQSKLYVLAHGHAQMPMFTNENGKWSASQLALMLEADGLPKDQRDIELLVCHAGQSVNDKATASKLLKIFSKSEAAKAQGKGTGAFDAKYAEAAAKGTKPRFFESDPEALLIPLAAQLAQALKRLGYTHFRVISYKCPVAQYTTEGHVHLDLSTKGGHWGARATDHPTFRVIWQ